MSNLSPLDQMLRQIGFYLSGDLRLAVLVGNLESLHDVIVGESESWKRCLFKKIGDLEQVNAVMLDRGMDEVDETGKMIVNKALNELVVLVNEAKSRPKRD